MTEDILSLLSCIFLTCKMISKGTIKHFDLTALKCVWTRRWDLVHTAARCPPPSFELNIKLQQVWPTDHYVDPLPTDNDSSDHIPVNLNTAPAKSLRHLPHLYRLLNLHSTIARCPQVLKSSVSSFVPPAPSCVYTAVDEAVSPRPAQRGRRASQGCITRRRDMTGSFAFLTSADIKPDIPLMSPISAGLHTLVSSMSLP